MYSCAAVEEDHGRDGRQQGACGEHPEVRVPLAGDEAVQADREGLRVALGQEHAGDQEFVDRADEPEQPDDDEDRRHERQDDRSGMSCRCDAPSTLADSSSSFGTVSKKPLMSHVFTPSAPPR